MNPELNAAIWGAITGGFMGLLVSLISDIALPRIRRWNLTREISILRDLPHEGFARFRVVNNGFWTINDAMLYIALDICKEDTVLGHFACNPSDLRFIAHIEPHRFVPLTGDQLCWNVRDPKPNPMKVSILAKERQPFSLCHIGQCITIPSEEGWPPSNHARVFLQRKTYKGWLKFVSADTDARYFRIEINPDSADCPCTIESACRFDVPSDIGI